MDLRFAALLPLALATAACSQPPFIDRPLTGTMRLAKEIPNTVFVCYNASSTTPAEVTALAREECGRTGRVAEFVTQTYYQCRLLVPTRAEFRCVVPPPGP